MVAAYVIVVIVMMGLAVLVALDSKPMRGVAYALARRRRNRRLRGISVAPRPHHP